MACSDCTFRKYWEKHPRSLLGRLWKFHTNFCPGWIRYTHSFYPEDLKELQEHLRTHGKEPK